MDRFALLTGIPEPNPEALSTFPSRHLPWSGCGSENEQGLGVWPRCRKVAEELAERFQGGPGVVHGGVTAAFFDEARALSPPMGVGHLAGTLPLVDPDEVDAAFFNEHCP